MSSNTTSSTSSSQATSVPTTSSTTLITSTTTPTNPTTTSVPDSTTSTSSLITTSSIPTSSTSTTTTTSTPTTSTTSTIPTSTIPTSSSIPTSTTSAPTTTTSSSETLTTATGLTTGTDGSTFTYTTVTTVSAPPQETSSASSTSSGGAISPTGSSSGTLTQSGKIAVAVVVPIAGVALLVLAGIYLWRKHKQKKEAEEQRRKEVEEYGYNPNADPTIPGVGAGGPFEMKQDGGAGYRGWGTTTLAGSTGRKASTTMSGGAAGVAYSDATSPTLAHYSDTRSGDALMHDGAHTPEGEILGQMGPSAATNRGDVHRGPSNASSSYSAAGHSDGSGEQIGVAYGGANPNYDQYGNPYQDGSANGRPGPPELAGQPVIRDVAARRNTRIENPAHFPQQSAGISQNF